MKSIVPNIEPMIAPASVPPEYWPEHDVVEPAFANIVVVVWRAMRTGVAGSSDDARVGFGACRTVSMRGRAQVASRTYHPPKSAYEDALWCRSVLDAQK
jgi:hypothetical protein